MLSLLALATLATPLDEHSVELLWMQNFGDGSSDPTWSLDVELVARGEGPARALAYETPKLTQAVSDDGTELKQLPDIFEPDEGVWPVRRTEGALIEQPEGGLRFDFGLSVPPAEARTLMLEGTYRMLTGGADEEFLVSGLFGQKRKVEEEALAEAGVELTALAREMVGFSVRVSPDDELDDVELTDGKGSTLWPEHTSYDFDEDGQVVSFLWSPKKLPLTAGVQVSWTDEKGASQKEELRDLSQAKEKKTPLGPFHVVVSDAQLGMLKLEVKGHEELLSVALPVDGEGQAIPFEDGGTFSFGDVQGRTFNFPGGVPDGLALKGAVRIGAEWTEGAFAVSGLKLPRRHF